MTDSQTAPGLIDIGGGHTIKFVSYKDDERAAIQDHHLTKDGKPCRGFVSFLDGAWANEFRNVDGFQAWKVESWEPLTLSPSLLCKTCGDHGFIRGGKWVMA